MTTTEKNETIQILKKIKKDLKNTSASFIKNVANSNLWMNYNLDGTYAGESCNGGWYGIKLNQGDNKSIAIEKIDREINEYTY